MITGSTSASSIPEGSPRIAHQFTGGCKKSRLQSTVPQGRLKLGERQWAEPLSRPYGTRFMLSKNRNPAMNRWASLAGPSGTKTERQHKRRKPYHETN